MTVYSAYTRRMCERFGFGLSKAQCCPRVVAGKRCLVGYNRLGPRCLCECYRPLWDHGRIWLDATSAHVMTSEPYAVDHDLVAAFQAEARALGIELQVTTESYWFSGTTLLMVRKTGPAAKKSAELDWCGDSCPHCHGHEHEMYAPLRFIKKDKYHVRLLYRCARRHEWTTWWDRQAAKSHGVQIRNEGYSMRPAQDYIQLQLER